MSRSENDPPISWQKELSLFLNGIGLVETSQCLEAELLILPRAQREQIPAELEKLTERLLQSLEQHLNAKEAILNRTATPKTEQQLLFNKKRRLSNEAAELVKSFDSEQVQIRATNEEMEQRINTFIQAKQSEVDASNRTEFLSRSDPTSDHVTCARTDAQEINRNIQMKFDIVNNEDGPLARSLVRPDHTATDQPQKEVLEANGAAERINNIAEHLNVKFESKAQPPFSLHERIKILENTLMEIERQHPKWAAVHFHQPNRSFPPPPPVTHITRPPSAQAPADYVATQVMTAAPPLFKGRANSSLTRAVIEQLHRQQQASVMRQSFESSSSSPASTSAPLSKPLE